MHCSTAENNSSSIRLIATTISACRVFSFYSDAIELLDSWILQHDAAIFLQSTIDFRALELLSRIPYFSIHACRAQLV